MISYFFAYVGLGPGPEFLPYFLALLSLVAAAALAVLQWPIMVILRSIAKVRRLRRQPPSDQPISPDALVGTNNAPGPICKRSDDVRSDR